MTVRKTTIPAIPLPGGSPRELQNAIAALKEATEVGLGRRGDPQDRFVTVRELEAAGIAKGNGANAGVGAGALVLSGGGGQVPVDVPGTINGLPNNSPPNYGQNDYTVPPAPTNVAVQTIAPNQLMVTWDPPSFGNFDFAEVYLVMPSANNGNDVTYSDFIRLSPGFDTSKPESSTNPNQWFIGRAFGSNFTTVLSNAENPVPPTLGNALNPNPLYVFVRFISLAGVAGPFAPQGIGAIGTPPIDPLTVLDLMTASVTQTNVYQNLSNFLGSDPGGVGSSGGVSGIFVKTTDNSNTLNQLYTIQAKTTLPGGNIVAAGFGLGITVNQQTGTATSIFAVDADQFAIMGGNGTYTPILSFSTNVGTVLPPSGTVGTPGVFRVASSTPDISSAFSAGSAVVVVKSSDSTDGFDGVEATVYKISGLNIYVTLNTPASQSSQNTWPFFSAVSKYLTLATNIPFIVDTATSTVGIRGKLVVDGLLRATTGEFNTLTANQAFIQSLRAGIVNANVVCGQSIIAGAGIPASVIASGSIDPNALASLNAWIVQLSTPVPGGYPLQVYNPFRQSKGMAGATLLQLFGGNPNSNPIQYPSLYFDGDFNLGGNATLNLRQGGAVAMGPVSSDGIAYTFWAGADADYGRTQTHMDDFGFFWIRPAKVGEANTNGCVAGFNANVFLGGDPLTIPTSNGTIVVVPPRGGGNATVFASAIVTTIHDTEQTSNRTTISAQLWLMPSTYSGPGPGTQIRTPVAYQPGLGANVGFFGAVDPPPNLSTSGGYLISGSQYDFKGTDSNNFALQGSVSVPPGTYKVFVELCLKPSDASGPISAYQANFFAMQTQR